MEHAYLGKEKKWLKNKMVSGTMLTLLLLSMLTLLFNVQPAKASGTIYIRADGSIDPPTAPISSFDNVTYTFAGNIYDEIVVKRSNIMVDGNGYTLQGSGDGWGFFLSDINNVTIKNTNIKDFQSGIYLNSTSHNVLSRNNITANNRSGIRLIYSSNNTISGNDVNNNRYGIELWGSPNNNTIYGNNITNNHYVGVYITRSSNNIVTGNIIMSKEKGVLGEPTDACMLPHSPQKTPYRTFIILTIIIAIYKRRQLKTPIH